jgi:hypothetical protein
LSCPRYAFLNGTSTKEGSVFLCRHHICCIIVSTLVCLCCHHSNQVTMDCASSYCTTLSIIYTDIFCHCRLMKQVMHQLT